MTNSTRPQYTGPTVPASVMLDAQGQPTDDGFYLFRNLAGKTNNMSPVVTGDARPAMSQADTGGTRGVGGAYVRYNPEDAGLAGPDAQWRVDHPSPEVVRAVQAYLQFLRDSDPFKGLTGKERKDAKKAKQHTPEHS